MELTDPSGLSGVWSSDTRAGEAAPLGLGLGLPEAAACAFTSDGSRSSLLELAPEGPKMMSISAVRVCGVGGRAALAAVQRLRGVRCHGHVCVGWGLWREGASGALQMVPSADSESLGVVVGTTTGATARAHRIASSWAQTAGRWAGCGAS